MWGLQQRGIGKSVESRWICGIVIMGEEFEVCFDDEAWEDVLTCLSLVLSESLLR